MTSHMTGTIDCYGCVTNMNGEWDSQICSGSTASPEMQSK